MLRSTGSQLAAPVLLRSFFHAEVWVARASKSAIAFHPPTLWHSYFCLSEQTCLVGAIGGLGADIVALERGPSNRVWGAFGF